MDTVDKLRAKIQVGTVLAVVLLTIAVGLLAVTGVYARRLISSPKKPAKKS